MHGHISVYARNSGSTVNKLDYASVKFDRHLPQWERRTELTKLEWPTKGLCTVQLFKFAWKIPRRLTLLESLNYIV